MTEESNKGKELVSSENLQTHLEKSISKEERIILDMTTLLQATTEESSAWKQLTSRLDEAKERLEAYKAGFIPTGPGWWTRTDSKHKWDKRDLRYTMRTMPQEIKEAWERVKALEIFPSFSIARAGADPTLVGNAGGKHFLIGSWVNLESGLSMGFVVRQIERIN